MKSCPQCGGTLYCADGPFQEHVIECRKRAARERFAQTMREAPKRGVQIGETLHLHVGEDTAGYVDKIIKRALSDGKVVTEGGVRQWIEEHPLCNSGKSGSEFYVWHADGNRVKVERVLAIKSVSGTVTKKRLGFVWRKYDAL